MRVVDTSAWIEWLVDSQTGKDVAPELPDLAEWVVPTIVQHELMRWLLRSVSEKAADEVLAFSTRLVVIPLSTRIAVHAAELSRTHKLPLADSLIYATALDAGADVLTCDAHFKGLPRVVYLTNTAL
jgi:predicted nucleic acid-binding protein